MQAAGNFPLNAFLIKVYLAKLQKNLLAKLSFNVYIYFKLSSLKFLEK